jgi:hypothetical protein
MFQCLTHESCKRSIRRCERSFHCSIPDRILEGAVSPPGLDADRTRPGLEYGMSGQGPRRLSIASARHRAACTAPEPCATPGGGGSSARPQVSRTRMRSSLTLPQLVWGEIGAALPAQFRWRDTIRAEHLECSRTASAAASTYSPDQLDGGSPAATWPRRSPARACHGCRDFPRRAPRPLFERLRLAVRCLAMSGQRASMPTNEAG